LLPFVCCGISWKIDFVVIATITNFPGNLRWGLGAWKKVSHGAKHKNGRERQKSGGNILWTRAAETEVNISRQK